jgi:hypothetical protein
MATRYVSPALGSIVRIAARNAEFVRDVIARRRRTKRSAIECARTRGFT